jgi:hypothetical protein
MQLNIKLRDGFKNSTVTIWADNKEVYHKSGLSSSLAISYADSVNIPVKQSHIKLVVAVEGGQASTKKVDVSETPFVEIWILDGKMELRTSDQETPML